MYEDFDDGRERLRAFGEAFIDGTEWHQNGRGYGMGLLTGIEELLPEQPHDGAYYHRLSRVIEMAFLGGKVFRGPSPRWRSVDDLRRAA